MAWVRLNLIQATIFIGGYYTMMVAERGNRVITITNPSEMERYIEQGYTIKEDGKVIHQSFSNKVEELEALCAKQAAEIETLKAELEKSKVKARPEVKVADTEDVEAPKKRTTKKAE